MIAMTFLKEYVIVSGASGFIGKHLLEALKKS
ncbi:CDP-abequose synthase, partial [Salmonella enterica]|nr:CDP-abequose synthase [Salmonella enterica subsp. enterica serovar Derby]EEL4650572.1 CDP-abequose synthase [Salmonella enterica]